MILIVNQQNIGLLTAENLSLPDYENEIKGQTEIIKILQRIKNKTVDGGFIIPFSPEIGKNNIMLCLNVIYLRIMYNWTDEDLQDEVKRLRDYQNKIIEDYSSPFGEENEQNKYFMKILEDYERYSYTSIRKATPREINKEQEPVSAEASVVEPPMAQVEIVTQPQSGEWQKYLDPDTNNYYYYNTTTGVSQWENPLHIKM